MDTLNFPTKRNLLLARQRLALARKGYDLLDKKRQVLISELAVVQGQANQTWEDLHQALHIAHEALHIAQVEMGRDRVRQVSQGIPKHTAAEVLFRSIMGTELPLISNNVKIDVQAVYYNLSTTTVSLDEAVMAWNKAKDIIISWAAIENSVNRLNLHIKKTQKRANALGNITIPMYEARIKYIQERLEERERDELARLKLVKGASSSALTYPQDDLKFHWR